MPDSYNPIRKSYADQLLDCAGNTIEVGAQLSAIAAMLEGRCSNSPEVKSLAIDIKAEHTRIAAVAAAMCALATRMLKGELANPAIETIPYIDGEPQEEDNEDA